MERIAFHIYLLWDLWRDKAMADFGVSKEFFDLVPQLPGSQRYLQ